ncbi:MAG: hypothetical protein ACODAF_02040 [Actinomycetota bacterium]
MSSSPSHDALMLAFSAPAPGAAEEEFNQWYDHTHIPQIMKSAPGIVTATRYRVSPAQPPDESVLPYLTIYEINGDPASVLRNLAQARSGLTMSPALDMTGRPPLSWVYDRIG